MKLASGENKPVRGSGNKAAGRADEVKEATYPSDFINPDGSKRSVAKKKTGRPIQHDQPTSGGRRKSC